MLTINTHYYSQNLLNRKTILIFRTEFNKHNSPKDFYEKNSTLKGRNRLSAGKIHGNSYLCENIQSIMYILLVSIVIGLFVAMLFVNVYFRVKVLKSYKKLVQNKVEFGAKHIFNKKKMQEEIYPRYPHMQSEIETFSSHIQYSMKMATVLIALITAFGAILMYYR